MGSDEREDDVREEYAALVRAVAAHVELERSFGIEAAKVAPPPAPAAGRPGPPPAPRPDAAQQPQAPRHVSTMAATDMFGPKEHTIEIPDGLSKQEQLDYLAEAIAGCTICPLHQGRTQVVFGAGSPDADLMFIGEAPGRDEDAQGIPFVGRAGQLLTKIIEAIDMTREDVYIANIGKCRPPNNRAPLPDEMAACVPFLHRQIKIIQPKIICLLGATALRGLLDIKEGITRLRGTFVEWRGIQVMPTYHPAYLLRNPAGKRDVWEDIKKIRDSLRAAKG